jgi:hypothetical protein
LQEELENKMIAISVSASKLTARTLAKALAAIGRKIQKERQKGLTPQGKQSVKKLMNHRVNTNSLDLSGSTRQFDRVARKYNVDYAFHKVGPQKYLLFFKAGQADAITACFAEYSKKVLTKSRRPSIREQLKHFAEQARTQNKARELTREAVRDGR